LFFAAGRSHEHKPPINGEEIITVFANQPKRLSNLLKPLQRRDKESTPPEHARWLEGACEVLSER